MPLKKLEIAFVTGNVHKYNELKSLLMENKMNVTLSNLDLNPVEIQSDSIEKVAEFKLRSLMDKIEGNFLIEDAGFFVETLNGFPGVYSSYVMKMIGNSGILSLIKEKSNRNAKFKAVIALYLKNIDRIHYFTGVVDGIVAYSIRGNEGFGFDPIFIPNQMPNKTFGEISTKIKNILSHRSKAAAKLIEFLKFNGY